MKRAYYLIPILCLCLWVACQPGSSQSNVAGHWEGNISLPGIQLAIRVDLENLPPEGWQGTIDIPAQGVRKMKLSETKVEGGQVGFAMAGIPGDPRFSGKVGGGGKEIAGTLMQGGQTFPFKIERKPKPAVAEADETPQKGVPGRGLAGFWQGSLKPAAGVELRLVLEITNGPMDTLGGVLVSVDQGNARVPMTALTLEKTNLVHFENQTIGGVFDGDISPDGADIEGEWQQMGRTTPMKFFRLENAPKLGKP